ncbi:MAG: hypothetical protein AAGM67_06975, partial [Bacteroidota bacterium]
TETLSSTTKAATNLSFAVLDFDGLCQSGRLTDGIFQMVPSSHSQIDQWLEDSLRESRARYLGLGDEIRTQLNATSAEDMPSRERDQALIDQFLASPPKSKGRRNLLDPDHQQIPDPGARSVEEGEELVTETFARLLVLQGKRADAIGIYQKLSLRFPQKSAYFDAQIEKIRTE